MPRLIQCKDCATVEVIPSLNTPATDTADPLLARVWGAHVGRLHDEQVARRMRVGLGRPRELHDDSGHNIVIFVVTPDDWADEKHRDQILHAIWDEDKGYPPEFYATKDTYREEAGKCFNRHSRPQDGCIDWEDRTKRLTDDEWERRGADLGLDQKPVYLCHFCPVASWVQTQKRFKRGDYDG